MSQITTEEQVLLELLAHALFSKKMDFPQHADWKKVVQEACAHVVLPLAFYQLEQMPEGTPPDVLQKIMADIAGNAKVNWHHVCTQSVMDGEGIPCVILKGCASAYYYPEPLYRSMGDVDFLVHPNDVKRAGKALEKCGFQRLKEHHDWHVVYKKPGAQLEVHFEPPGVPKGVFGEIVREYLADIFETAQEIQLDEGKIRIPDSFHHGLVLLLHTCNHLTGEGIGLRHLCDWAVFANHLSDAAFREIFEEKLKRVGLWRFAQLLTQLASRYLGMPEKAWAMEAVDETLLKDLILDILYSGNFGKKDKDRIYQGYLISSRGRHGVKDGALWKQLFLSVHEAVQVHAPFCKKHKWLLPVAWVYVCSRQLWLIATGKRRKVHPAKMISGAEERRKIYQSFRLYEPDK